MKARTSTTPEKLAVWLADKSSRGMTDVYVFTSARDGRGPIFHDNTDEKWSATEAAERIFEAAKNDAEILGGKQQYRITTNNDHGVMLGATSIVIETGRPDVDWNSGNDTNTQVFRVLESCMGRYHQLVDLSLKVAQQALDHNQKLHEKVIKQVEAVEAAQSLSHERQLRAEESKAAEARMDKSLDALMSAAKTWGPVYLASKAGVKDPKEMVKVIMKAQETAANNAASASAPTTTPATPASGIAGMAAALSDDTLLKFVDSIPPEAQAKLFDSLSTEEKLKLLPFLDALAAKAEEKEKADKEAKEKEQSNGTATPPQTD